VCFAGGKGMQVLLVDDNSLMCEVINHYLISLGYQVGVAGNGAEALRLLSTQRYSLCLIDLRLPDMDGEDLLEALRAMPEHRHCPALAMSGMGNEDRDTTLAAGFDDFLAKPIDLDELQLMVEQHINRAKSTNEPLMDRLVLWDVDGTLISTDGIAAEAMRSAMRQVVGSAIPMERTAYAGKTDWQIIRETFPSLDAGAVDEQLHLFASAYVAGLEQQREALRARSRVFDGVLEALATLQGQTYQAPLTGNIAAAARIKLECTGLLDYLDLEVGAYGDDHYRRPELVPIAVARAAERYSRNFAGTQVVVVGDTPNDIDCGKANGARTIAVATGPYPLAELQSHDPDVLLPDLRDTAAVVAAILDQDA
jgi:phosphoglycolate phosphatase